MSSGQLDGWDYVSLSLVVVGSCVVGVYQIFGARKTSDAKQFLVSSDRLTVLPLVLSIVATHFSAIALFGYPVEFYMNGINFIFIIAAIAVAAPIGAALFLPVFFRLNADSMFHYLELRFSRAIRLSASIIVICQMLLHSSIVIYAPALALNLVTGLHLCASVVTIGVASIVYTAMGGIRAVVWADAVQCLIMVAVLLMVVIKGMIDAGGIDNVWQRMEDGDRAQILIWEASPHSRYTFWTLSVAFSIHEMTYLTFSQFFMQRYLSSDTIKKAQITFVGGAAGVAAVYVIFAAAGVLMSAKYFDCDPLLSGKIKSRDQMLALFAVETLSFCKGLPGLFVGGVMCAVISTLSSNLNSLSALTMSDYITYFKPKLTLRQSIRLSTILVVVYGLIAMAFVMLVQHMGGVFAAVMAIGGIAGGAFLALFFTGMLLPCVNNKGAICAFICSMIIPTWAYVGSLVTSPVIPHAQIGTQGCNNYTFAQNMTTITQMNWLHTFYSTHTFWYPIWSLFIGLTAAVAVSKITGFQKANDVDSDLLFPFVNKYVQRSKLNLELEFQN